MKRQRLVRSVVCVEMLSGMGTFAAGPKPNIIFLMAEDIGNDLACYGTKGVKTPTLDRLAKEGIRYNRFYTNSPICSPSRTPLMLGIYQNSVGGHCRTFRAASSLRFVTQSSRN